VGQPTQIDRLEPPPSSCSARIKATCSLFVRSFGFMLGTCARQTGHAKPQRHSPILHLPCPPLTPTPPAVHPPGRKVRFDGNDDALIDLAKTNAMALGAGHTFIIFIDGGFPVNCLNAVKAVPEVCRVHCATANPTSVVIAKTSDDAKVGVCCACHAQCLTQELQSGDAGSNTGIVGQQAGGGVLLWGVSCPEG
jgi:hypothetical protein